MMTVSVITVCLNAAESIEQTIRSVLDQTYSKIEFVIIDGGSTDGTLDIINHYRNHLAYLVSERDNGLYHAMNKGVRVSKGDVIFFLNADDRFVDNEVVKDVMSAFREDPSLDIVFGDVLRNRKKGIYRWVQPDQFSRKSLARQTICHQAVFARRNLLVGANEFNEDFRIVSDLDWLIRVAEQGVHCRHISRDITLFSVHGLSNTDTTRESERLRMMRKYYSRSEVLFWRTLPRSFRFLKRGMRWLRRQLIFDKQST